MEVLTCGLLAELDWCKKRKEELKTMASISGPVPAFVGTELKYDLG
jgi:hypothetical protein